MQTILNRRGRVLQITVALFPLVALTAAARADIYQWEYINPADPSQGKQQSMTLAPDGAGVDAVPGAYLAGRDLSMTYLIGSRLYAIRSSCDDFGCQSRIAAANLTATNLTRADLTNSSFGAATLTDADFTGAEIRGASFGKPIGYLNNTGNLRPLGTGISIEQLYSTASYQAHDLSGIDFSHNFLPDANFTGQNLAHANFFGAYVAGADFTGAEVRGAEFSKLLNYDVTTSPTRTFLTGSGISPAQIYATASYQARDLRGIAFYYNDLADANFVGQNLTNADFQLATLTGADLTAADVRGSQIFGAVLGGAITTNLIWPNGRIKGLDLDARALLVVRDYDGDPHNAYGNSVPPIPITIDQHLAIGPGGTLRMVFEADVWDSTISFAPGIPVTLGGVLELTCAPGVNLADEIGRTFDLFDWNGVNPTGVFTISSPYTWDLSNLYTTGEVTLTAVPEPAGFALVAAGAFSLTFYRRRKIP